VNGGIALRKRITFFMSLLLIVALLVGCSSNSRKDSSQGHYGGVKGEGAPAPAEMPPGEADLSGEENTSSGWYAGNKDDVADITSELVSQMGSKIIKSGYLAMETLDFEETTSEIIRKVQQAGGFIASSNIQGWSREDVKNKPMRQAHYKVRIPSGKFEQFITDAGELGNVTRNESWGEDVSSQYFDTEARLKSLTIQEDRLLTILSKAEQLTDIIELERELSSIRYEIENLTGTLRKYDNLVAYSTLELDIREVREIKEVEEEPVTLWGKMVNIFRNSIKSVGEIAEGMLLFIIGAIPFLLLLGVILLVLLGIIRLVRKIKKTTPIERKKALILQKEELDDNKKE
jgi:hypothetical protein